MNGDARGEIGEGVGGEEFGQLSLKLSPRLLRVFGELAGREKLRLDPGDIPREELVLIQLSNGNCRFVMFDGLARQEGQKMVVDRLAFGDEGEKLGFVEAHEKNAFSASSGNFCPAR